MAEPDKGQRKSLKAINGHDIGCIVEYEAMTSASESLPCNRRRLQISGGKVLRLKNKVALITGGNSGIGLATARRFREEGARVAIIGRNQETLEQAAQILGSDSLSMTADVSDMVAIEAAIKRTVEVFGKLDVVFANAGITMPTPLGNSTFEIFDNILRVNVTSVFFLIQACLPHLNEGASLILNGSVQSYNGRPGWSAYAASKSAVRTMARVLASELSPRGIRVNVVTPGSVDTPLLDSAISNYGEREPFIQKLEAAIPLGRIGHPDEVANAVLFLASDESSFVQATEIVVDGGASSAFAGAPIYR